MCLVCAEWNAGRLTSKEALRNLGEMIRATDETEEDKKEHYFEACEKIMDKEVPFEEEDEDVKKRWEAKFGGQKDE